MSNGSSGFNTGSVEVAGVADFAGSKCKLVFQNEFILARLLRSSDESTRTSPTSTSSSSDGGGGGGGEAADAAAAAATVSKDGRAREGGGGGKGQETREENAEEEEEENEGTTATTTTTTSGEPAGAAASSRSSLLLASVPDLICLVDRETARPIFVDEVKEGFGLRVAVLCLPLHERWKEFPEAMARVALDQFCVDDDDNNDNE